MSVCTYGFLCFTVCSVTPADSCRRQATASLQNSRRVAPYVLSVSSLHPCVRQYVFCSLPTVLRAAYTARREDRARRRNRRRRSLDKD